MTAVTNANHVIQVHMAFPEGRNNIHSSSQPNNIREKYEFSPKEECVTFPSLEKRITNESKGNHGLVLVFFSSISASD